jgi:hypothetical protein
MSYLTIVYNIPEGFDVSTLTNHEHVSAINWGHSIDVCKRYRITCNELGKAGIEGFKRIETLKAELKAIDAALDDPRLNLSMTAVDLIQELKTAEDDMQKHACQMAKERDEMTVERDHTKKQRDELPEDAERYRWLRAPTGESVKCRLIWNKREAELDAAIDELRAGVKGGA